MKKFTVIFLLSIIIFSSVIFYADAAVSVKGYYRKNGTYVQPHYRSNPDGNPYNNWSYPGNTNPYTGETAGGNPDTYLKNYYGGSGNSSDSYSSGSSIKNVDGGYFIGSTLFCSYGYYKQGESCLKAPENGYAYGGSDFSCNLGYVKIGNRCLSTKGDEYCINTYGAARYDTSQGSCTCNSHYAYWDGKCIVANQYCQNKFGYNSRYDGNGSCVTNSRVNNYSQTGSVYYSEDNAYFTSIKSYIKSVVDYIPNINCNKIGFVKSEDIQMCNYYKQNRFNKNIRWSVFNAR